MEQFLILFVLIPLLGFVISIFIPDKKENLISFAAFGLVGIQLLSLIVFVIYWLFHQHPYLHIKNFTLYQSEEYSFYIDFGFDKITLVYSLAGAFLTFLVTSYSRLYLHRERGYKRFFNTMLLFYFGYNLTIFAGNIETLLIGWEILGISSFLLIAFYRDRYLPVKNAVKVFTVYRIGDVGLILAMWMSHHLFHANITFYELENDAFVSSHLNNNQLICAFISIMVLITAAAKSAQLPFSSWLPRAMEGPTPSSAIFYGSLSVHLGVYILLRTFPFWEHQTAIRFIIAGLGILTSIITSFIARVQSSVKSQVAYSSIAQIGLIFVEVAAGFETLALIHFAGNACLRTYQLLVSPSVVSYLIREQFYNFEPRPQTIEDSFPKKIANSFYLLSLREWELDSVIGFLFWNPLKSIGKRVKIPSLKTLLVFMIPIYLIGVILLFIRNQVPQIIYSYLPIIFSIHALLMVLKSFTERRHANVAWSLIVISHFLNALAISLNEEYELTESLLYLTGIVIAGTIGYFVFIKLNKVEKRVDLNHFHGHSYEHPWMSFIFLIACLGLSGFPITPTFLGADLMFSHIHKDQVILAFFTSLSFIITGISLVRIYSRLFLGPHTKPYHEIPYKSS